MSDFRMRNIWFLKPVFLRWAFFVFISVSGSMACGPVMAQKVEQRVSALEDYVSTVGPTMQKLADTMQGTLSSYSQQLEVDLQNFSHNLQTSIDSQISGLDHTKVQLDLSSTAFQRIDTNVGIFLIAISKMESIDNGIRLHLNIGNMHNADFSDFALTFLWGPGYSGGQSAESWSAWRQSLTGAEFTFKGKLKKGRWSPVSVDLVPGNVDQTGYLECQLNIAAVELESW